MRDRKDFITKGLETGVPEHTVKALANWVFDGVPTGNFLRAVMDNNLFEACLRADGVNILALKQIVEFIVHYMPCKSHGLTGFEKWRDEWPKIREEWLKSSEITVEWL